MFINCVTITGADDSTDIDWMQEMSEKYTLVEWGILVSESQMGSPRFPSMDWINKLNPDLSMDLSMHVCGKWVRDIIAGDWDPLILTFAHLMPRYDRMQLNFHGDRHQVDPRFFYEASHLTKDLDFRLIFQLDGVNDGLVIESRVSDIEAYPLFDTSGGTGSLPFFWPAQPKDIYCGYAGGLGPENVLHELAKIAKVAPGTIWIDMETRVRTPDNRALDPAAVESVLEQVCNR